MDMELKGWISWSFKNGYGVERMDVELQEWKRS